MNPPPPRCCRISFRDLLEAPSLLIVRDLAGHANVLHSGHEDQITAGERAVRGDPRPLLPERLLQDLDEDLLSLAQSLLDGSAPRGLELLRGEQILGQVLVNVSGVQERIALETDVDERRLHAREALGKPCRGRCCPTMPRWASLSMKSSATTPSSRSATRVSQGVELTIKSLFMEDSFHEPALQDHDAEAPRLRRGRNAPGSGWSRVERARMGRSGLAPSRGQARRPPA